MEHVQKNKRLYSFLLVLCLVCNLFTGIPAAEAAESDLLSAIPSQTISTTPAQITLSIAKDENGSAMAFNWVVTDTFSTEGKSNLVYSENSDMSDAVTVSAQRKDPNGNDIETDTEEEWGVFENVYAYSAKTYSLTAGETYYYQVGNETDGYTETESFKAPDKNTGSFSFVVSADTQSNTKDGYNNTRELYNYIAEQESNAAFLIHTGDIVEDGNVSVQWEWFFEAAKNLLCSIPMMTTPGNHESGHHDKNLVNFKAHTNFETLTAPEGLSENVKGTVYSFEYGNALFICLNTAAGSADDKIQFDFLRQQVEQTNKKWKIVFMHIPPYDPGKNHYSVDNETGKLLSDAGVDLVLSGHEHAYARNTLLTTDAGIKEAEPGNAPTYVIGGSVMNAAYDRNSKSDLWSQTFVELRKPSGGGIYAPGVYASVDVKEDSLTYTAYYKADGENFSAIDTFTINKNGNSEETPVEKKPLEIDSAEDLVTLSKMDISDRDIILTKDIDMEGLEFTPLNGNVLYNGIFDGQGHVIKNLSISNTGKNCTGLIGCVGLDGTVKNLGLENVSIIGANSTGGITGALLGTVSSCYVTGEISGAKNVGGVTGILHAGTIENCWTDAVVTASSYGGGLFGCTDYRGTNGKETDPSVLMQNGFTGPVTDRKHKVINNLVMGKTKEKTSAMIGDWSGSKGSSCNVFDGNVLWLDSVATGNIYGYVSSSAKILTAGCENVYCVTPALTVDTANIANFTTRTAAQLGEQKTYEALGWDFENIWTWSAALGHPVLKNVTVPAEPYEPKPDNSVQFTSLVTTFAGDAKTSRAFTWHTNTNINKSAVQAIEKKNYKDETSFSGSNVISTTGTVTILQTSADGEKRNVHHANLTGLTAGTQYYYRVGDGESVWSDIYTFTTEAKDTEEFTFYHITDTQASSGNYKNYKSILDAVTKSNSEGAFILHSGDVMQNNQTSHYDAVYKMIADYTSWLPSMVTPGNHELEKDLDKDVTNSAYAVENPNYVKGVENFKSHYMYPDNGPENSKQLVYSFDYGNAHFAILNSNNVNGSATTGLDDMTKQIAWLKNDMNASDKTWKIVSVHVGPYNTYGTSLTSLANALDELGVDVVFFGHNHVFMRSNAIKGGEIKALNQDGSVDAESGTVYYSSGSAGGSGTINEKGKKWFSATKSSSYPTYGVIKVTEDSLTINTYELQNEENLIDTVTIKKNIQESDKPVQSVQLPRSVTYLWETANKNDGTFLARFNWIMDADETAPSYLFYAEKDNYEKTGKLEQIAAKVTTVDLTDKLNAKGYKNGTANYKGEAGAEYCYAPVKSYKAETPALKPNTEYVYCVGADISDSNSVTALQTIKTPAADTDTFDFLFFTDAQQGACGSYEKTLKEYETLTKTLNQAVKDYPDAAFILSGGDQVNYGIDTWEWDAFFASSQDVFSRYPLYLSTGNHECDGAPDWAADGKWTPVDQTCSAVLGRYNPPENGVAYYGGGKDGTSPVLTSGDAYEESKAGNYYFIYGDTLFLVMDFQDTSAKGLTEAQQEWLKTVVENNPAKWKVAVMHKTLFGYRVGDPTAGVWRTWSDTFDEAGIDLVLMGHDHVYTRTKYYSDGAVTNPQEDGSGTTYITSSSANDGGRSDRYNPNAYTLVNSTGHYDQSYIGISISPKAIRVTSKGFDAEGKLVTVEDNALVTDTPRSMYKADTETEQKAYQLNVTGGMIQNIEGTTAEITAGTEVTVTALVPEGQEFVSWTVSGLEGIDINSHTLTFQMPEHNVMLSATFRTVDSDDTDSNGNSSGSSSGGGFSGVYNYPVKLAGVDGANVTLSDSYAVAGEIVTITISPDRGKQVAEVIITDASGNAVSSKKIANNQYSFTMPANTVNVDVILKDANYDLRIVMQINSKNILQNTDYVTSDVAPVIVDNRTMVPIRIVTELLGGTADWDAETRTVTLQINGKILSMVIDEEIPGFGTSAVIIDSRTYVPIRYVAEKLGANVEWIEAAQQIVIEK